MAESADITHVWRGIEARLPTGWRLDSLRCASTGLSRGDRSDQWIAVAVGPDDPRGPHPSGGDMVVIIRPVRRNLWGRYGFRLVQFTNAAGTDGSTVNPMTLPFAYAN